MDTDLIQPPAVLLRSGSEPIIGTERSLQDFWQWGFSDVLNNTTRGILAEYLVASALAIADRPRITWDPYDLTYYGLTIEVKSCAYIQSWARKRNSSPCFTIRETRAWDSSTNVLDVASKRQADVYVFCLLKHADRTTVNPIDVSQWEFFVVPSSVLTKQFGTQKTLSLKRLLQVAPTPIRWSEIKSELESIRLRVEQAE